MKFKSLTEAMKHIEKNLHKIEKDFYKPSKFKLLADFIADRVRARTRRGYGVPVFGKGKEKLAPLKKSTIKARERMKANGQLSSETSPRRSNLTMTGKMLDDLYTKVVNNTVKIKFKTNYSEQKAKWAGEGSSNRAKREFRNLSSPELKDFMRRVKNILTEIVKKYM